MTASPLDNERKIDPDASFDDPIEVTADSEIRATVREVELPIPEWEDECPTHKGAAVVLAE